MLRPSAVVELVWRDETGSTAVTQLNAPSSTTVDDIAADAEALAAIIVPLTDAVLIKIRIKYRFEVEPRVPASGSTSIKRTGLFFFATSSLFPFAVISIPAIKDSILETSGPREGYGVDVTNSDVIALENACFDNNISNPFADLVTVLVDAYLQSRVS